MVHIGDASQRCFETLCQSFWLRCIHVSYYSLLVIGLVVAGCHMWCSWWPFQIHALSHWWLVGTSSSDYLYQHITPHDTGIISVADEARELCPNYRVAPLYDSFIPVSATHLTLQRTVLIWGHFRVKSLPTLYMSTQHLFDYMPGIHTRI
jgi:hypothetical protein